MNSRIFFVLLFVCIRSVLFGQVESQQVEPKLVLPTGHTYRVYSAVFSPDGKLALTASGDYTARIYEVATGKELQVLKHITSILN